MKKIVLRFSNGLLCEAIAASLRESGEFIPSRVTLSLPDRTLQECRMLRAELLLMEVSYAAQTTLGQCMEIRQALRRELPECRIVLLCDENSAPEIAHQVMLTKQSGAVDDFFYTSVSESYMIAALQAI